MAEYQMTVTVPEKVKEKITWLKYTLGYTKFSDLLNFTFSTTETVLKGVLAGKQLALYDPETDEIELLRNTELDRIAALRKEQQ